MVSGSSSQTMSQRTWYPAPGLYARAHSYPVRCGTLQGWMFRAPPLIVEDEEAISMFWGGCLREAGFDAQVFSDATLVSENHLPPSFRTIAVATSTCANALLLPGRPDAGGG